MKRKIFKTTLLSLMSALIFLTAARALPQDQTISFTLRIEGMEKNLFYSKIEIPCDGDLSIGLAFQYLNAQGDGLQIGGLDTGFVSSVNGETSGAFGGWDGWLYTVNGDEATVGIDEYMLSEGDSVLLYYGDPYGVGMQFPQIDESRLEEGILIFTSRDTAFDADYNPVVTVNPVAGATVYFYGGDTCSEYTTDANGAVTVNSAELTPGAHRVRIEKYAPDTVSGKRLPLVLRLPPDYTVNIKSGGIAEPGAAGTKSESSSKDADIPGTHSDRMGIILPFLAVLLAPALLARAKKRVSAR